MAGKVTSDIAESNEFHVLAANMYCTELPLLFIISALSGAETNQNSLFLSYSRSVRRVFKVSEATLKRIQLAPVTKVIR